MSTAEIIGSFAIVLLVAVIFALATANSVQVARRERRKASAATGGAEGAYVATGDGGAHCSPGDAGGSCGGDGGGGGGN